MTSQSFPFAASAARVWILCGEEGQGKRWGSHQDSWNWGKCGQESSDIYICGKFPIGKAYVLFAIWIHSIGLHSWLSLRHLGTECWAAGVLRSHASLSASNILLIFTISIYWLRYSWHAQLFGYTQQSRGSRLYPYLLLTGLFCNVSCCLQIKFPSVCLFICLRVCICVGVTATQLSTKFKIKTTS